MPVNSANQGIPEQQGADPANLPSAQVSWDGVMENRLVQRYTNEADRTARRPAPNENELSGLAAEDRYEVYDSANWVSAYRRSLYASIRKTADQTINNVGVLTNDTQFVVALPTAGIFQWTHWLLYDSATAQGLLVAYTIPVGATMRWGGISMLDPAATSAIASIKASTVATSGGSTGYGAAGVGTVVTGMIWGEVTMGGTAGNLQFQFAQSVAAATNTTIRTRSRMEVWRFS